MSSKNKQQDSEIIQLKNYVNHELKNKRRVKYQKKVNKNQKERQMKEPN